MWEIFHTPPPESTEYYFNRVTKQTQWTKPDELKSEDEKLFPPCPWVEYKNPNGQTYYAHSITHESSWDKPRELIEWESAKAVRDASMGRHVPPASVKPPPVTDISNMSVEQKLRENQAKLAAKKEKKAAKRAAAEAAAAAAQAAASSTSASNDGPSASNATTATASSSTSHTANTPIEEPVYGSKDEARAAFRSLLVDKQITSKHKSFTDTIPLLQSDIRFRALKTPQERKKVFTQYIEDVIKQETELKKRQHDQLHAGVQELLRETPDITTKAKFKTFLPILELDDRYQQYHAHLLAERLLSGSQILSVNQAAVLDKMEEVFYKYIDELIEIDRKKQNEKKLENKKLFLELLKEYTTEESLRKVDQPDHRRHRDSEETKSSDDASSSTDKDSKPFITADTSFRQLESHSGLTSDPRWSLVPSDRDRGDYIDEWLDELDAIAQEKYKLEKEERRKVEKELRVELRKLLQEECEKENIHTRSRFKEVLPVLKDDPRYINFIDWYVQQSNKSSSSSSSRTRVDPAVAKADAIDKAKDLFTDFLQDLSTRLESKKKILKGSIVKDLKLVIQPTSTPAQLSEMCQAHPEWKSFTADVSTSDLHIIWMDIIEKVKAKIAYWHKKQKDDTIKVAVKLLRSLFASRVASKDIEDSSDMFSEADSMTYEVCRDLIDELNRPLIVPVPKPDLEEGEMEPEEGEIREENESVTPATMEVPRQHSSTVREGLAAWELLTHPPIPPPPEQDSNTPFTTDEYARQAVQQFHRIITDEIEATERKRLAREKSRASSSHDANSDSIEVPSSAMDGTHDSSSSTTSRKRVRSASHSRSRSRSGSHSRSRSRSHSAESGELRHTKRPKVEESSQEKQKDTEQQNEPTTMESDE